MNIIYFGTSEFAKICLEKLLKTDHTVKAVVTQPDRPKGRNLKLGMSPVKELAVRNNITVFQPSVLDAEFAEAIKSIDADVFVVIAYGHILKKELLSLPKKYCINVHASLLPKYRGPAPINWAVINGDKMTGVTSIRMNERMDDGDIIHMKELAIGDNENASDLYFRLAELSGALLVSTLELVSSGKEHFIKQDRAQASYAAKLKKDDGLIDWRENADIINNKIRGLLPWPGAFTFYDKKSLKILKAEVRAGMSAQPGEILACDQGELIVSTGNGALAILELQAEASKRMNIAEYLRGHRLKKGSRFRSMH